MDAKNSTYFMSSGVAVGSSIGHALGGFFGGSNQTTGEANGSGDAAASQAQTSTYQSTSYGTSCEVDAKAFTRCLDENKGSEYQMSICGWYLEQLVSVLSIRSILSCRADYLMFYRKLASLLLASISFRGL